MKSMRELMEAVMAEGGKGPGAIFRNEKPFDGGYSDGPMETIDMIVGKIARMLGWSRSEDGKSHPYLHGIENLRGKVYPRVFTKSNVEFAMFGIDTCPGGKCKKGSGELIIVVAAKRRSASWNTRGEDSTGRDPHSVTYFRIPLVVETALDYDLFVSKIKKFTQYFKRNNANSDGPGIKVTG
jgi:hypothetical protein